MIDIVEQDGNILCLHARGKLTHQDYQQVMIPRLDQLIKEFGKARVLLVLGDEFLGWEPVALWDDAKLGITHRADFERCAVVGAPEWVEWLTGLAGMIVSGEVRNFAADELSKARVWIKAPEVI